ncbi:MAG: hypothetical protein K0B15_07415 [Lentimicrobium sp.]|nr:hypothetical protein [Lentimicrobium sp.]
MNQEINMENENEGIAVISTSDWLITILLLFIPIANLVLLLVWSFRKSTNPSKSNFSRAVLLLLIISFLLFALILTISGVTIFEIMREGADFIDIPSY